MSSAASSSEPLAIDTDSAVADWARWCSRGGATQVEAIDSGGRPGLAFVADRVVVDSGDAALVARLVDDHGAEIVPYAPVPPAPKGLGPREGVDLDGMPLPVILRLTDPPPPSSRAASLLCAAFERPVSATSAAAAGLVSLVSELAADGLPIGLDLVGQTDSLPLETAPDRDPVTGDLADTLEVAAFRQRSRVAAALQLVEAFRQFRVTRPVTIGILDSGFWLDGRRPATHAGQAGSDFGRFVMQLNLLDESVGAGGPSGVKNGDGYNAPWHGNAVASVAAARVGNSLGAAGVGGTVARPVLFKTDLSLAQIFRCLQVCLAWGIDILNMSWSISRWYPLFSVMSETAWNRAFQHAADNGLILVTGAGNEGVRIPEDASPSPRPATRTPGTITVGWLDGADNAAKDSNFGSSVDIWAPGDFIPVMPDPNNVNGSFPSGTSIAAPFVSGIIALMSAVGPPLNGARAKELLQQTGWRGPVGDKVGVGVDAYTAVLAAMGGRLPDDAAEPNGTAETARPLVAGPGGVLVPSREHFGFSTLSTRSDEDWYRFDVRTFSRLDLELRTYAPLGGVAVSLEPADQVRRDQLELREIHLPGLSRLVGLLAPGLYRVRVTGPPNLYKLSVGLADAPLELDQFEVNDSFEKATPFRLRAPGAEQLVVVSPNAPNLAGTFSLNLHKVGDTDFFVFDVEQLPGLFVPMVHVSESDELLDLVVYNAEREPIDGLSGIRSGHVTLREAATSFVEIRSAAVTRYRLTVGVQVDPAHIPGPLQEVEVVPLPDVGDPPFLVNEFMHHFHLDVDGRNRASSRVRLATVNERPMQAEILDTAGMVVGTAHSASDGLHSSLELEVGGLEPGSYVLRVAHPDNMTFAAAGSLQLEVLPLLRR